MNKLSNNNVIEQNFKQDVEGVENVDSNKKENIVEGDTNKSD